MVLDTLIYIADSLSTLLYHVSVFSVYCEPVSWDVWIMWWRGVNEEADMR